MKISYYMALTLITLSTVALEISTCHYHNETKQILRGLDSLDASKTAAQQPFERNNFKTTDSLPMLKTSNQEFKCVAQYISGDSLVVFRKYIKHIVWK